MFLKRLGKDEMRKMIVRYVLPGVEAELNARRVYASFQYRENVLI